MRNMKQVRRVAVARVGSGHVRRDARNASKGQRVAIRSHVPAVQRSDITPIGSNMRWVSLYSLMRANRSRNSTTSFSVSLLHNLEKQRRKGSHMGQNTACTQSHMGLRTFSWSILECTPSVAMVRQTQHMGILSSCLPPPIATQNSASHIRARTPLHPNPTLFSHTPLAHAFTSPSSS